MRIHSIEAIPVSYPEPNDFNALRHLCLCKITADDGQVGWGESITQFPEANFAAKAIIEGMALGRSVLDLHGGPVHEKLPAIASCHAHFESIPEMAAETAEWVSTGL